MILARNLVFFWSMTACRKARPWNGARVSADLKAAAGEREGYLVVGGVTHQRTSTDTS
jgi:hypothetical protein